MTRVLWVCLLWVLVVACADRPVDPDALGASLVTAENAARELSAELGEPFDNRSVWVAENSRCMPSKKVSFTRTVEWRDVAERFTATWVAEALNGQLGDETIRAVGHEGVLIEGRVGDVRVSGSSRLWGGTRDIVILVSSDCFNTKYQLDIRAAINRESAASGRP